jgi:hypothetical protein
MPEMDPDYGKNQGPDATAFLANRRLKNQASREVRFFFVFRKQALTAFV